jgi:ADP-ribose pyrophosphatase
MFERKNMTKLVSRNNLYEGKILDLGIETHAMPDGRQSDFEVIRHPGGSAVLPVLSDGRLLLIKQFRPSVGEMVYEIPAGRLETGESPAECAARELIEEAGYSADELLLLGTFWSTVGFCDEKIFLYLARSLNQAEQKLEQDELIDLCPMPLATAIEKIENGEILDSKTQLAVLHYQRRCTEGSR